MVDLENGQIVIGDIKVKIIRFDCWWFGPTGLVPTFDLVRQMHQTLNLDIPINMAWKATPVAVAENGMYEELR